jgi:hypothetical protein
MRLCPGRGTAGPSARSRTTITTFRSNSRASGREVTATACRSVHCTGGTAKCAPQVRPPSPRATHFSRMLAARTLARTLVRTLARTLVRTLSPHPRPHPCPHPRPQPQPHPSPAPSPAAAAAPLARTLARSRSRTPRARRLCREGSVVRARAASRRKEAERRLFSNQRLRVVLVIDRIERKRQMHCDAMADAAVLSHLAEQAAVLAQRWTSCRAVGGGGRAAWNKQCARGCRERMHSRGRRTPPRPAVHFSSHCALARVPSCLPVSDGV